MSHGQVEVFASGMNGALQRTPRVRAQQVPLTPLQLQCERWLPTWPRLKTVGLRFPEAPEPPRAAPTGGGESSSAGVPAGLGGDPDPQAGLGVNQGDPNEVPPWEGGGPPLSPPVATLADLLPAPPEKLTRIQPPDEAISIEDRLFYLLQPPLETWLKGQELIMPF